MKLFRILVITLTSLAIPPTTIAMTPLHDAARRGDTSQMVDEIERGADIEARDLVDMRPLHYAACSGNPKAVLQLILCNARTDVYDNFWLTPLHYALGTGNSDLVHMLLIYGADIEEPLWLRCKTPLQYTARHSSAEVLRTLLEAGAAMCVEPAQHDITVQQLVTRQKTKREAEGDVPRPDEKRQRTNYA